MTAFVWDDLTIGYLAALIDGRGLYQVEQTGCKCFSHLNRPRYRWASARDERYRYDPGTLSVEEWEAALELACR